MDGDLLGICEDYGDHITYSKKRTETHAEYLKRHRVQSMGHLH